MDCQHLDDDPLRVLLTIGDDETVVCRWCHERVVEQARDEGVDAAEITIELIRADVA